MASLCVGAIQLVADGMTVREMKAQRVNVSDIAIVSVEDTAASEAFHGVILDQGVCHVLALFPYNLLKCLQAPTHVSMPSAVTDARVLLLADDVTMAIKQEAFTYAQFHTAAERTSLADAEQQVNMTVYCRTKFSKIFF